MVKKSIVRVLGWGWGQMWPTGRGLPLEEAVGSGAAMGSIEGSG
jgi:hypothetical protein